MSAPTEDSTTIVLIALFGKSKINIENVYQIELKSEVKIEELPAGAPLSPEEYKEFLFFVMPARSWNAVQKELIGMIPDLNLAGIGFKTPLENIILGPSDDSWFRIMMKIDAELENDYKLKNEIRWGTSIDDENKYPFVILTQTAWNSFQRKIDECKIRDLLKHRARPIAQKIPKKAVFKVSLGKFQEWKRDGFKT